MGRPGLSHHPKFLMLARTLGEVMARGVLELVWEVSYESGDDRLGGPDAVEAAARWRGERGVCFAALRDAVGQGRVGFIEERDGVWCVHDLWDHAPDYVRKRATREAQRRTKGQSLAAEQRSLTGQRPASDRALTPPRAPAPTRAPSTQEEDLPRAAPAGPRATSDIGAVTRTAQPSGKLKEVITLAGPREGEDATYKALVAALFLLFRDKRGADYEPSGKDWRALADLRERHDSGEIIRRWGIGLQAAFKARCDTFWDLRERWNALTAPEASGGVQKRAPDPNQGIASRTPDQMAEETDMWEAYRENRKAEGLDP